MALTGLLILFSGFLLITIGSIPPITHRMRGLFYGWKLVGVSMLVFTMVSGTIWSGMGVWVKTLELQFGWSRTQLTGAFSLTQLEASIVGPFTGYLIDRLGPQRMVFIGLTLTGLGFIVFSRTTNLTTFYLAYNLMALGTMAGSWNPLMSVINRWFSRRRGTAMAIASEGHFVGGFLLVPALAWAVTPGHLGWSLTALWLGVVFLAVAWPISRLIRLRPEDYGEFPDGDPSPNLPEEASQTGDSLESDGLTRNEPDFTPRQAIRTKAFWFICLGHALGSMLYTTFAVHLIPLLTDQGLSLTNGGLHVVGDDGSGSDFQFNRRLCRRPDAHKRGDLRLRHRANSWLPFGSLRSQCAPGFFICGDIRCGLRRPCPINDCHPRRILRDEVLRDHLRHLLGANVGLHYGGAFVRGGNVRFTG